MPLRKAQSDEQQLSPGDIATLRVAIAELKGEPWATALYDHLQILVETGWTNARELLDLQTELADVKPTFAMEALRTRVNEFAFLVNQREQDYLNQLLDQGLSDGWTPGKLSSEIAQAFSDGYHITDASGDLVRTVPTDAWSDMVARTELNRAQTMGAMSLYHAAGVQTVQWVTNGTPCDVCAEVEGETFPIDDVPVEPPLHPNCCPPGTLVQSGRGLIPIERVVVGDTVLTHRHRFKMVTALSRRVVSEDLVELRVGTNILRVTGNHPVYTGNRWAPASTLKVGDEIASMQPESMFGVARQANNVPTQGYQHSFFGRILSRFASPPVPAAAVNLNGNHAVGQGYVDTKLVCRHIRDRIESGLSQSVHYDPLVSGLNAILHSLSPHLQFRLCALASASGIMGGSAELLSVLGRGANVSLQPRLAPPPPRQSHQQPSPVKCAPIKSGFFGQFKDGFTRLMARVKSAEHLLGVVFSKSWHTVIVPLCQIKRVPYDGIVYNFAVADDESYVAQGVVVHNCNCALVAADADLQVPLEAA